MSYEGIVRISKTILEDVPNKRTLRTDFKPDGKLSEQMIDIHHLIRSNQYILVELYIKNETLKELVEKLNTRVEDLESQISKTARDPEVDQLIKDFDNLKVSNNKLDELKKAVNNISVASGAQPPQPMFNWRDKEIPEWKEYLKDPLKFKK